MKKAKDSLYFCCGCGCGMDGAVCIVTILIDDHPGSMIYCDDCYEKEKKKEMKKCQKQSH